MKDMSPAGGITCDISGSALAVASGFTTALPALPLRPYNRKSTQRRYRWQE